MFAYCLNNPVIYRDSQGAHAEMTNTDEDQRNDLWPDPNGGYEGPANNIPKNVNTYTSSTCENVPTNIPTYPSNPYDFHPDGLELKEYVAPGSTGNGGILKWIIPGTKIAIFEWDEDYKRGSHYHAMLPEHHNQHDNDHIYPHAIVEEPWRSKYF